MQSRILLILVAQCALIGNVYGQYSTVLGCYADVEHFGRDMMGAHLNSSTLTLVSCNNFCRNLGFKYAAAQSSTLCFCDNTFGANGKSSACNMPCGGDSSVICGGPVANTVMLTGVPSKPAKQVIGCYADNGSFLRDLMGSHLKSSDLTLASCNTFCYNLGFKYAAAQYSTWCFCDNKYGAHGVSSYCNMPCGGDSSIICGGPSSNTVMLTGIDKVRG